MTTAFDLRAPLTVIAMQGWQRGDWYDSTSFTWVNPSPNLRDLRRGHALSRNRPDRDDQHLRWARDRYSI